jgi:predicted TIM-barrel fold metal-dependent hydrolase
MRKQANVYADLSALCYRPWQLYNALLMAMEAKVTEKIFFGTDWPFTTIKQTVSALQQLCKMGEGTGFPTIPQPLIDEIIHHNPLPELGLA